MPKAIVITYPKEYAKREALELAKSAGYEILAVITQQYLTRSRYGIGVGKASEVKELVNKIKPDVIIFDEVLGPSQTYNLAKLLQKEVIDRERLILSIFEKRAKSAESSIQVKLAQLRYEITRVRESVRLAKKGEQPGFYGLGRYEVDDYYRDIKRRISTLKKKLSRVAKRRELYRYNREKEGLHLVSLTGYTSAGKTTLFNILTGTEYAISNQMFTTLSTYTKALMLEDGKVLLSDTVGFISKLPAYMIEAFKSTLEELRYADLVLLVIDISDHLEELLIKYHSCIDILNTLQVSNNRILYVLNKIDLIKEDELLNKVNALRINDKYIAVSAKKAINIDKLLKSINDIIFRSEVINKSMIRIESLDDSNTPLRT